MQAWKGPQVAYPSARHQNDKATASLSGAYLYAGLRTGSVCMSVVRWRCLGGAAGSVCQYSLLGTEVAWTHLWCLLIGVHFISVFQIGICSSPCLSASQGKERSCTIPKITTANSSRMCHLQQTTVQTAFAQPSGLVPPDDQPSHPLEVPHHSLEDLGGSP